MEQKLPLPPFTTDTAKQKIQMAEDAWNSNDPVRVSKSYTINSEWRNRNIFLNGREEIVVFLTEKWKKELDYKLVKEYWAHTDNRIAVRFEYEYHNAEGAECPGARGILCPPIIASFSVITKNHIVISYTLNYIFKFQRNRISKNCTQTNLMLITD